MEVFGKGQVPHVMSLVWTTVACCWLDFPVSSLYSNVIRSVSLAVTPIAAAIVFHDLMNGLKIISMLLARWVLPLISMRIILMIQKAINAQTVANLRIISAC
ncbi:unnamed protein product [Sphenostylis stenocarpa]|uniref:Uncharacterized protein n=1 Tax=Sphenostylis stenocarpa TaxID=92480 RepID=A0AA86T841_9FABA|nr:unnamed protein product [Sphenostylis stenocarpa]